MANDYIAGCDALIGAAALTQKRPPTTPVRRVNAKLPAKRTNAAAAVARLRAAGRRAIAAGTIAQRVAKKAPAKKAGQRAVQAGQRALALAEKRAKVRVGDEIDEAFYDADGAVDFGGTYTVDVDELNDYLDSVPSQPPSTADGFDDLPLTADDPDAGVDWGDSGGDLPPATQDSGGGGGGFGPTGDPEADLAAQQAEAAAADAEAEVAAEQAAMQGGSSLRY